MQTPQIPHTCRASWRVDGLHQSISPSEVYSLTLTTHIALQLTILRAILSLIVRKERTCWVDQYLKDLHSDARDILWIIGQLDPTNMLAPETAVSVTTRHHNLIAPSFHAHRTLTISLSPSHEPSNQPSDTPPSCHQHPKQPNEIIKSQGQGMKERSARCYYLKGVHLTSPLHPYRNALLSNHFYERRPTQEKRSPINHTLAMHPVTPK